MENTVFFKNTTVFVHAIKYTSNNADKILDFCKEYSSESFSILGRDNNGGLVLTDNKTRVIVPVNNYLICNDKKFSISTAEKFENDYSIPIEGEIDLEYNKEVVVEEDEKNDTIIDVKTESSSDDNLDENMSNNKKKSSSTKKNKKRGKKK